MRITTRMMSENAIIHMNENLERVHRLQEKISSTKQFQNASDDPARASTSLSLRSHLRTLDSYASTAASAGNWMTATDNAFDQLEQIANRASALILTGLNDTLSPAERDRTLGVEMQNLLNQAVELGNTKVNGLSIFAGFQVSGPAFELVDAAAPLLDYQGNPFTPKVVNYVGDTGAMQRSLGPDQTVNLNVRGDQAILGFLQNLNLAVNAIKQDNIHKTGNAVTDPLSLESALSGVKSSLDTLDQYRTGNGARLRQVESAADFLETVKLETQGLLSNNEDTNLAEGIAQLSNQQTTYQAVLEVSQRAISALSLFDYLR